MEWNGDLARKETGPMGNFIGHLKGTRPKDLTLSRFFQRAFAQSIPNKIVKADLGTEWGYWPEGKFISLGIQGFSRALAQSIP